MRGALFFGVVAALLAIAAPAWAQNEVDFTATVDDPQRTYYDDELVILSVEVAAPVQGGIKPESMPDTGRLKQIGQSQSTSMSFNLGSGGSTVRSTVTYQITLRPPGPGTYPIRPGRLKYKGQVYKTSPITITVKDGKRPGGQRVGGNRARGRRGARGRNRGQANNPFRGLFDDDDFFNRKSRRTGTDDTLPSAGAGRVFAKARLEPQEVYVGEQALLTVFLYHNMGIADDPSEKMPALGDFWTEGLDRPNMPERRRIIEGQRFSEVAISRRALFPLNAGELRVEPVQVQGTARSGFFGQPFKTSTDPVVIKVKPLPTKKRPPGFKDANVGIYRLDLKLDRRRVAVGDAITAKVILTGEGNLRAAIIPELPKMAAIRSFPPQVTEQFDRKGAKLRGIKTAEYLLSPQRTGKHRIPPLEMQIFNPMTRRYERLATRAVDVVVTPAGSGAQTSGGAAAQAGGVNVLKSTGLRAIRYGGELDDQGAPLPKRGFFWLLLCFPPFLLLGLWGSDRMRGITEKLAPRNAPKRVVARAIQALETLEQGSSEKARDGHAELSRVLVEFLGDRFGKPATGMTLDELRVLVTDGGFPEELAARVVQELEACDFARFSPAGQDPAALREAIARARELVSALERP